MLSLLFVCFCALVASESLSFVPPISETACLAVDDEPAVLVYWMCEDVRCSACEGEPQFIAVGREESGRCFQAGFKELDLLSVTYLGCTADRSKGCVWTADYNGMVSRGLFPTFSCTTGSNTASGDALPLGQPLPSIARNQFAVHPKTGAASPAPFELGTCFSPMSPTRLKRSYQIFCSHKDIPSAWKSLPKKSVLSPFKVPNVLNDRPPRQAKRIPANEVTHLITTSVAVFICTVASGCLIFGITILCIRKNRRQKLL